MPPGMRPGALWPRRRTLGRQAFGLEPIYNDPDACDCGDNEGEE
jgi:hypothetical protein